MSSQTVALVGFAIISWVFAWLPGLWCGLDVFKKEVIVPFIQIPTGVVPITELITQGMALYGMTMNTNAWASVAYVVQGIAFPLWTYTFLGLKNKGLSLLMTVIALVGSILMWGLSEDVKMAWLWFVPLILHKAYDVYWTQFAEFKE